MQSVKSWAAEPGNIDADDLFVSGNADEVFPDGSSLLYLNCTNMEVDIMLISLSVSTGSYVEHPAQVLLQWFLHMIVLR